MDIITKKIEDNISDFFSSKITIYEVDEERSNEGHKVARARVLYKGKNRNKTFINDTFAKLLQITAPYIPIVGEYDAEKGDFLGHTENSIPYGCVVKDNNFAWEEHLDNDGLKRTYACFDVILWTKKYEKANDILNKSLSMELDRDTLEGTFKMSEGETLYHFTGGELLALCVLGDDIEPCFEGAGFYDKYSKKPEYVEFDKFIRKLNINENGGTNMDKRIIEFKLSHDDIRGILWEAVNQDSWKYGIAKVYDDYALLYDYEEGEYNRQYYSKNDNEVTLGDKVKVVVEDLTMEEFEKVEELRNKVSTYEKDIKELESKFEKVENDLKEKEAEITTLTEDKTNFEKTIEELESKVEDYEELAEYKLKKENEEKKALLSEYEALVPADFSFDLREDLSAYNLQELEAELAVKAIKHVKTNFQKKEDEIEDTNLGDFNLKDQKKDDDSWISIVKETKSKK